MSSAGLDAPKVSPFYNWTLSALTLLICDLYVYQVRTPVPEAALLAARAPSPHWRPHLQSKGSIDSAAVDRLDTILRVAEHIRGRDEAGADQAGGAAAAADRGEGGGAPPMPAQADSRSSFLWLLRDHHLHMRHEPKEEMLEKLDPGSLRTLRRCFGDYDCAPLPRPVDGDVQLRELDGVAYSDLRPEFREEFSLLERRVLERLSRPRVLGGRPVTGAVLADLLRKYTSAIAHRSGIIRDLAHMPTQRQMVGMIAGQRAMRAAAQAYIDAMRPVAKALPVEERSLAAAHTAALRGALAKFQAEAVVESEETSACRAQLLEQIECWRPGDHVLTKSHPIPAPAMDAAAAGEHTAARTAGDLLAGPSHGAEQAGASILPRDAAPRATVGAAALVRTPFLERGLYHKVWTANVTASSRACEAVLRELFVPLAARFQASMAACGAEVSAAESGAGDTTAVPYTSVAEYDGELQALVATYHGDSRACGPCRDAAVARFAKSKRELRVTLQRALQDQGWQQRLAAGVTECQQHASTLVEQANAAVQVRHGGLGVVCFFCSHPRALRSCSAPWTRSPPAWTPPLTPCARTRQPHSRQRPPACSSCVRTRTATWRGCGMTPKPAWRTRRRLVARSKRRWWKVLANGGGPRRSASVGCRQRHKHRPPMPLRSSCSTSKMWRLRTRHWGRSSPRCARTPSRALRRCRKRAARHRPACLHS